MKGKSNRKEGKTFTNRIKRGTENNQRKDYKKTGINNKKKDRKMDKKRRVDVGKGQESPRKIPYERERDSVWRAKSSTFNAGNHESCAKVQLSCWLVGW